MGMIILPMLRLFPAGWEAFMATFDSFFLMNTDDVRRYAVEVLHRFDAEEETECREIGDGNINYVFQVRSLRDAFRSDPCVTAVP